MIEVGNYNTLKVSRMFDFGVYLQDGREDILLPKRWVPAGTKTGDMLKVFVYHDSESRIIATTEKPFGVVGDIVPLEVVSVTPQGAFMNWGLMKDLFVPKSKQLIGMRPGGRYLVKIYLDEQTGRVAASEKIEHFLSNEILSVKEMDVVNLVIYRRTDIGYLVIINNQHTGVLHFNEIYRNITAGDRAEGYIKHIYPDNKIDVVIGKPGYQRVEDEQTKILRLLQASKGSLPYNDKSSPDDIYEVFGMSKKVFKMTLGALYKQRKIAFTDTGIELVK